MPCISHGAVQVVKAKSFVDGYGFLQFWHCFDVYLAVAGLPGEIQAGFDELFSQPVSPGDGSQVHFYQFAYALRQTRGGVDTAAACYLTIEQADVIAAARLLEASVHIVGGGVVISGAGSVDAKLPYGIEISKDTDGCIYLSLFSFNPKTYEIEVSKQFGMFVNCITHLSYNLMTWMIVSWVPPTA